MRVGIRLDPEREAARLRRSIKLGPRDVASAIEVATLYLGDGSVIAVAPEEVWGDGEATPDGTVLVRCDLTPIVRDFTILHEVAEIWIARRGFRFEHFLPKERAADAIAACLLAPAEIFREAVADLGPLAVAELAAEFATSQTAAALRVGEVAHHPVRVERPGLSRVRGAPVASWDEARRVDITDAPDRWALVAA
jgi:hypothetical protein